jgi:hypothetical protein
MIARIRRLLAARRGFRRRLAEVEQFRPGPEISHFVKTLTKPAAAENPSKATEHVGGVTNG